MIRLFILFFLIFVFLEAKEDVDEKIKKTNIKLKTFSKTYSSLNQQMAQNAQLILKQKKEILIEQKHLQDLTKELDEKKSTYESNVINLESSKKSQESLKKEQDKLEEELILTISKSVSLSVILEESSAQGSDSLMELEVLESMLKISKEKANKLNKQFFANANTIDTLNKEVNSLEAAILDIDTKRKELLDIQESNKKALKELVIAKDLYKVKLKKILENQDMLKKTLSQLNIIKIDEIRKAKEEEERKKAFASQQMEPDSNLPKVIKHGSSYQAAKTKRYTGPKTIAPLDSYTITKKYGTYTDPIYGIKIFNESISLKPKEVDAKVKTVFNGKVIYADKTAVLDNIVIVEHSDGIHTIYANLSQISPNIKTGVKIKKGYTIGRVSDELIFEVTQKSYHINPIRLFQ
jgi:murein DD-endopeptidase MepM/ murein hydrolase activator NlpD